MLLYNVSWHFNLLTRMRTSSEQARIPGGDLTDTTHVWRGQKAPPLKKFLPSLLPLPIKHSQWFLELLVFPFMKVLIMPALQGVFKRKKKKRVQWWQPGEEQLWEETDDFSGVKLWVSPWAAVSYRQKQVSRKSPVTPSFNLDGSLGGMILWQEMCDTGNLSYA